MKKIVLPIIAFSIAGLVFVNSNNAVGYSGLTAPSNKSSGSSKNQPPGYKGLIPGYVPEYKREIAPRQEEVEEIEDKKPKYGDSRVRNYNRNNDYKKGSRSRDRMSNVPKFPVIKTLQGKDPTREDYEGVRYFAEKMRFSPRNAELFKNQRRIDGLWPAEHRVKETINRMIKILNESTGAEKKKNARMMMERLEGLRSINRTTSIIPMDIKVKMGYPSEYLKQEQEATRGALRRISSAAQQVQKFI